jgi:hypothetical protein
MAIPTLEMAIEHIRFFEHRGSQGEIALTGVGEPLLHPRIEEIVWRLRDAFPDLPILLSTNGLLLREEQARLLAEQRIGVYVSLHRPEVGTPAVEVAKRHGILLGANVGFAVSATDWAGRVQWYVSHEKQPCTYLRDGRAVVLVDGHISTCCWDGHAESIIGHVADPVGCWLTEPKPLCETCSLDIVESSHAHSEPSG